MRLIDADALDMAFTNLRFNQDMSLAHWGDRKDWCLHGHEVEKLIYDAPTVSGWISVKDRLPEEKVWVLCLCRAGIREVLRWQNGQWYHDPQHAYFESFVLYWMPLPEPPKE